MAMIDLDMGIGPSTITPTNQAGVVDFRVALLIHVLLKNIHGNERGDISDDDGRHAFRFQDTSHYYFKNSKEGVDSDGRGGDRSNTRNYYPHNPGDCGRLLVLSVASRTVHECVHVDE